MEEVVPKRETQGRGKEVPALDANIWELERKARKRDQVPDAIGGRPAEDVVTGATWRLSKKDWSSVAKNAENLSEKGMFFDLPARGTCDFSLHQDSGLLWGLQIIVNIHH